MNPGATEEAGKAVGSFIDSLKSQPLSLALVVMNVVLLAYLFYMEMRFSEGRKFAFEKIVEQQQDMAQMLAHCIPADDIKKLIEGMGLQRQRFKLQSDESHPVELPPLPQARPPGAPNE